jgi:Zn-dependent protease with chaperone function
MDFSRHQQEAAAATRRLRTAYILAVVGVVMLFNVAALVAWRLIFGAAPLPYGFLLVNTMATAGLIVGGTLVERHRLAEGAASVADHLRSRPLHGGAAGLSLLERRAVNVLEEMALAAHQPIPRLYVMDHDPAINALAVGLSREDVAVILTRGSIERLNRDELQGVVAHEVAHLASGDVVVHSQLAAMNYGLELVANAGRRALASALPAFSGGWWAVDPGAVGRSRAIGPGILLLVPGSLLLVVGWAGHLAARMLTAAMGRTREFHADALAVRLTRNPKGLGNALRKITWMSRHDAGAAKPGRVSCPIGMDHALFQSGDPRPSWHDRWLATHPPLADRIARLLGEAAAPMVAERGGDDELALDHARAGTWLALSALPPLVYVAEGSLPDAPATASAAIAQQREAQLRNEDMAALVAASHNSNSAAAIAALLVLGGAVAPEIWPLRWRAAMNRQAELAMRLRRLGVQTVEGLRWPLLELCAATIKPLARPWQEDLLRMLRGQIEVDQRVTLAEWIYYMLLRARLLPPDAQSWRGEESEVNAAEAVRWIMAMLARCVGEPDLRAQRVSNELIQRLDLSRTGQSYPPLDVGGLQAAVASLRQLPMLQRPLLMKRFVKFLPPEAPIEARDFLRVLALIIDCPIPEFRPVVLVSPDTQSMFAEATTTTAATVG